MRPTGGHLLALGMVLYNADYSLFGPEPHLPLTLVTIGFQCLVSGLVYAYARRRIGPLPALIPAILILFLGAGWEILMSSAVLPNQMAMAAGIGMLLALDRRDRRGDALAFVLLACSIASFSIGLAFAAAAALRILLERRELGLRRLVIVVVPLALYAVWYVWALKYEQGNFAASNIGSMPSAIFDQINASLSAVTGRGVPSASDPDEMVFLPGRNVFLLAKPLLWCHLHGVPEVALGSLATNPFPDATPAFFRALEDVVNQAVGGAVHIRLPFAGQKKRDVMLLGRGLPLEHTFSCIRPAGELHCGQCNKCAERRHAFADAGMADPTRYA